MNTVVSRNIPLMEDSYKYLTCLICVVELFLNTAANVSPVLRTPFNIPDVFIVR